MLVQFNNLNLADETKYLITGISGWDDVPEVISGSAVRPRRHGSWPGGLLTTKRVVVIDLEILPDDSGTVTANLKALRKAMAVDDTERPLTIDLDYGMDEEVINARVTSAIYPMGQGYGSRRGASIEFTASDPRRYISTWNTKIFGTRTRTVIPQYPVKYPKKYVTYSKPGELVAINEGDIATPPKFTVEGPIKNPTIRILDAKGTRKISFNVEVGVNQDFVIDVLNGTARMSGGNYYGDSRGALLEDMDLRPGSSTINFSGTGNNSQNARLTVAWRSASL